MYQYVALLTTKYWSEDLLQTLWFPFITKQNIVAKERTTLILVYNRKSVQNYALFLFYVSVVHPHAVFSWGQKIVWLLEWSRASDTGNPPLSSTHSSLASSGSVLEFGGGKKAFFIFYDCGPPIVRIISGGRSEDNFFTVCVRMWFPRETSQPPSGVLLVTEVWQVKMKSILILFLRQSIYLQHCFLKSLKKVGMHVFNLVSRFTS